MLLRRALLTGIAMFDNEAEELIESRKWRATLIGSEASEAEELIESRKALFTDSGSLTDPEELIELWRGRVALKTFVKEALGAAARRSALFALKLSVTVAEPAILSLKPR